MRVINSKQYLLHEVLNHGTCAMCNSFLKWSYPHRDRTSSEDGTNEAATAVCCRFIYSLQHLPMILDGEPGVEARVLPLSF